LQKRYGTGSSGTACNLPVVLRTALATRGRAAGLRALEARRARVTLRDALIVGLSITRRAGIMIHYTFYFTSPYPILLMRTLAVKTFSSCYLRRSAIMRSVRRLCRVLAPSVGKPQGVFG